MTSARKNVRRSDACVAAVSHPSAVVAEVLEDALRLELEHAGLHLSHEVAVSSRTGLHCVANHLHFEGRLDHSTAPTSTERKTKGPSSTI